MNTIQSVRYLISDQYQNDVDKLNLEVAKRFYHKNWAQDKIVNLDACLSIILPAAFKAIDLEIVDFQPSVHYNQNIDYKETNPIMMVQFTCKMVGRRKPYESTTHLSNNERSRRDQLIRKHQDKFKTVSGYKCSINSYSLDKAEQVLVEVHI